MCSWCLTFSEELIICPPNLATNCAIHRYELCRRLLAADSQFIGFSWRWWWAAVCHANCISSFAALVPKHSTRSSSSLPRHTYAIFASCFFATFGTPRLTIYSFAFEFTVRYVWNIRKYSLIICYIWDWWSPVYEFEPTNHVLVLGLKCGWLLKVKLFWVVKVTLISVYFK